MSVAELNTMTSDEMIIHLFTETADNTMSRLALKILVGTKPLVTKLRTKVKETKTLIWYKSVTSYEKLAHREKFCQNCKTRTHDTKDCWGPCEFCGKSSHKKEFCRYKTGRNNPSKTEPIKLIKIIRTKS